MEKLSKTKKHQVLPQANFVTEQVCENRRFDTILVTVRASQQHNLIQQHVKQKSRSLNACSYGYVVTCTNKCH